jgi:hypothetical protein
MSDSSRIQQLLDRGTKVDEVVLNIDYQIIEHFSRYLYGSPNKAVEELVSNGFDAFAARVFVYLPGQFCADHVVVWDDGWSMDAGGLKDLWLIASSPKGSVGRVARGPRGERKMIGKFGIGKLASYAVGNTITHICRKGDEFLLVSIDYRRVHGDIGGRPTTTESPLKAPIVRITKDAARAYLSDLFTGESKGRAFTELFDSATWTVAVVGDLKSTEMQPGRLMWVLGNGMPLRPDFQVFVNDDEVTPRLKKDALVEWRFDNEDLRKSIETEWAKELKAGRVKGQLVFGSAVGVDPAVPAIVTPYVDFPNLSRVWGTVRLFDESLIVGKASEQGRSHGFFLLVLGRLLNPDDEKFLLDDPSFATFYRSQFILHVDGLDGVLLADREGLQRSAPSTQELALLQGAVYRAARSELDNRDTQAAEEAKSLTVLPTRSREHYREPLTALLMKQSDPGATWFDLGQPKIERKEIGEEQPVAVLSPRGTGFEVNASHPYYRALESRFGTGKRAQEYYRTYDMFAVSERLLEGHLYDIGVPDEKVKEVLKWRDGLFRELAEAYGRTPSELITALINASYTGDVEFENAIMDVLNGMGFTATRDGSSGKKDGLIYASAGPDSYTLTFEAKGSKSAVQNDKAEISGAANHREAAGADHAVVVAREFVGFKSGRKPVAILEECRVVKGVSIMTVDAFATLYAAVSRFGYTLDVLKDVFFEIESPDEKLKRIETLQAPTEDFDYKGLLNEIWSRQNGEAQGDVVPYRSVWQSKAQWKAIPFEMFERRLIALETLAGGRIRLRRSKEVVHMLQAPDIIVTQIERALAGDVDSKAAQSSH